MIYTLEFIRGLSSTYSDVRINNITDFIEEYNDMLQTDGATPAFSRTSKYKSFPKKHFKRRGNEVVIRGGSNFRLFVPNSDIERIQQSIRGTLNKINDSNSSRMIAELLRNILVFNSVDTLDILATEVHKKMIYDKQFQFIYIDLCHQIWSMQDWHDQLITIVDNDGELYWGCNYNVPPESTTLHGPFANEELLRADSRHRVSFLYTLLTLLQKEFNCRDKYLASTNESLTDESFNAKRHIFTIIEFITKLYHKKYINECIVHVMFFDLLGIYKLNDVGKPLPPLQQPNDIWMEAFLIGFNIILSCSFCDSYMSEYYIHLGKLLSYYTWSNRLRFMIEDTLSKRRPSCTKAWSVVARKRNVQVLSYDAIEKLMYSYQRGENINIVVNKCMNANHRDLFEIILNAALDSPKNVNMLVLLVERIHITLDIIKGVFCEFLEQIEDITIDCPKADELLDRYKSVFM